MLDWTGGGVGSKARGGGLTIRKGQEQEEALARPQSEALCQISAKACRDVTSLFPSSLSLSVHPTCPLSVPVATQRLVVSL